MTRSIVFIVSGPLPDTGILFRGPRIVREMAAVAVQRRAFEAVGRVGEPEAG